MDTYNKELDVKQHKLKDDQICIVNVPVAGLSGEDAGQYLQSIARSFKTELDRAKLDRAALFIFPKNPNGSTADIKVLTPKDGQHYMIQVPVDGLPAKERIMYLKMMKEQLTKEWPKTCSFSVVPVGLGVKAQ